MASVKFSKDDPEWIVLNEFWQLLQKHWQPEDTETYWSTVIEEVNAFGLKEPRLLRRNLASALINIFEARYKEMRKNA